MFEKTYELPLARNYVRHWGVAEAVRELLQNALDSDSPLEYSWGTDSLQITSRHARLEPKTLLLGLTSKAEAKDKIGSFGEGYKIALLVLTRENRRVTVFNNDVTWSPEFRKSRHYGEELLTIVEAKYPQGRGQGLSFVINNLTEQEMQQIQDCTLQMQESIGEVIETSKGQILRHRPGMLYVNGLFVCGTELQFGYNIKPEFLKLERDRQTVSSFDLAWLTKEMWFETGRNTEIAAMMEQKVPDLMYAKYSTPDVVREACYQHFRSQYPDAIIADSQAELNRLVAKGMTKVVFLGNDTYSSAVKSCRAYKHEVPITQTPQQVLEEFFRDHRGNMRRQAIVAFKTILNNSSQWRTQ